MDRRTFLGAGAALAGLALAGCSDEPVSDETLAGEAGSTTRPSTAPTVTSGSAPSDEPSATTASSFDDGDGDGDGAAESDVAGPLRPADFEQLAICALVPRQAEGPYPNRNELLRRDITEGAPGWPLRLGLRVVDASCAPLPGALVDVWHCDATGDYSSYTDNGSGKDDGEGTTYLRGTQQADDDGIVEFGTIFPGWYEGRAVHIHVTVRDGGRELHTTQLYFPETTIADVVASPVYAEFGPPDTSNAADGIGGDAASDTLLLSVRPATAASPDAPMLALGNLGLDV